MTINQFRKWLYRIAKYSGDVQAVLSPKKNAIPKRIGRRVAGRITGAFLSGLFR